MIVCKVCGEGKVVKNGKNSSNKQKYKCKSCFKTFSCGDDRLKYSPEKRLKVLKMVLEGVGIRAIERLEKVPNPLIIYWIRHFANILRKELRSVDIPDEVKNIEILELDELFTYVKKNSTKSMYGLLLIETETKLLMLK